MNNLHRVQNIFISDGTALPANNAAITTVGVGDIGVFGADMTALNPAGGDTITTQPSIYIVEGRVDEDGNTVVKRSSKISGLNIIAYKAESYRPATRKVDVIGYNRKTATGSITVANSTNYKFGILFKNDKWNYSNRPEMFSVNFDSSSAATQFSIATQIANSINNATGWKNLISAVVVGDGTGAYGLTGATDHGVEIMAKDVNQFANTTYTPNQVYFSTHVDDSSGFGAGTTSSTLTEVSFGSGTYQQVYNMENKFLGYEGVTNRTLWPIPTQTIAASNTYKLSAAITPVATGTTGEDVVVFDLTIAAIIRVGEKVEIDGVNYEVKYIKGDGTGVGAANAVVLTSPLLTTPAGDEAKVRYQYDLVNIEFNDSINTPTGVVAVANKSVIIAVPAIDAGGAYTSQSTSGAALEDLLNAWMATTPGAFAAIAI